MSDKLLDILTYSSGTTLCLCEAKYYWRYAECLRPKMDEAESRDTGKWSHVGFEHLTTDGLESALAAITDLELGTPAIGPDVFKIQQRAARARAMTRVAAEKWPMTGCRRMAEVRLEMPIVNPETGACSRTFRYAGMLDGVDGATLIDWKTVSDPAAFIRQKALGYQTELYAAALEVQGVKIQSAVFRLIVQPTIKFCNKDGGSERVYEDRCVAWLKEDASRLLEQEMYLDAGRIAEAKAWLWSVTKRILENRKTGRWLRNEYACHTWNRECEYMPLCLAQASGNDVEWIAEQSFVRSEPHPELKADPSPST